MSTFLIVAGLMYTLLDPDALKPRLIQAVAQATGRTLAVSGPMGIRFGLDPSVTVNGVSLSNPPGFSRPEMLKIDHVEISVALLPLLRRHVEVTRLTLSRPDILLETDPAGHANWLFTPSAKPPVGVSPTPDQGVTKSKEGFAVSVRDVRIEQGRLGWRDGRTGKTVTVEAPGLTLSAPPAAPMHVSGSVLAEGRTVTVEGHTGSLDHLRTGAGGWPVALTLRDDGAMLKAEGHFDRPLEGRGYVFTMEGTLPDPSVYATRLPWPFLGLAKGLTLRMALGDGNGASPLPTPRSLRIGVGSIALDPIMPGARLENVMLSVEKTEPIRFAAHVVTPRFASDVTGAVGDLAWLMRGAKDPVTLDAAWKAEGASATVKGVIRSPEHLSGYDLEAAVDMADPARLFGGVPTGLKDLAARAHAVDAPGVTAFQITANAGDLSGEGTIMSGPRPVVTGKLTSRRLDLDVLMTSARPVPASAAVPLGAATPSPVPTSPQVSPSQGTPPQAAADKPGMMLSERPLPLAVLKAIDADLAWTAGVLHGRGVDIANLILGFSLKNGVLTLAPFSIASPDQSVTARLTVDAGKTPPPITLMLRAPVLALKPLFALLGLPPAMTGNGEIQADLTALGDTPHALAASLNGWMGVAVQDGRIDTQVVNRMLEQIKPIQLRGGDIAELRCFALRADIKAGVATLRPLALNTPALILEGEGGVDLGRETLSLRLRPRAKIGGTGISLPVRITGPWRKPATAVDIAPSSGGGLAGLVLGGKDIMGAAGGGDPCPGALAHARETPLSPADTAAPSRPEDKK